MSHDQKTGAIELTPRQLRWRCEQESLTFDSTDEVTPVRGVVGQDTATDALRFGLEIDAPGQNIFVRGQQGSGRLTLVRTLVEEVRHTRKPRPDRCLVHNFSQPNHPVLLQLATGTAPAFQQRMEALADYVRTKVEPAVQSENVQVRVAELNKQAQEEMKQWQAPFEGELKEAGLALMSMRTGEATQPILVPILGGQPVPPDQFQALQVAGRISEEEVAQIAEKIDAFEGRLREMTAKALEIHQRTQNRVTRLVQDEIRTLLDAATAELRSAHPEATQFLADLTADLVTRGGRLRAEGPRGTRPYEVNILATRDAEEPAPVVVENTPTATSLLGSVDAEMLPDGTPVADHMSIRPGSILQADGGYLVLEAADILAEPGAWRALVRTLRAERVEWEPPQRTGFSPPLLKPQAVPVDLKVIILGPSELYALLDVGDREFGELFKVLADFDSVIDRNEDGVRMYAAVLARLVKDEGLLPFDASAVGALVEHGARIAAQEGKLSARFGRLGDIAREASFVARKAEATIATGAHVRETVRRTKTRAELPARRFRGAVRRGAIRLQLEAGAVGQVNGLAVLHAGPLTYGFPTRISATVGPGTAGTMNIEGEAQLSGAIHTKGFHILGGLLRTLLPTDHPHCFDGSIAFEQSYGGIDGDSASGAEVVCFLSAMTGLPVRQDLAMTGAIDQLGSILPVGAVNEKVEGFHDLCREIGFTGTQGVVIPGANVGALVLREDVVASCEAGQFHLYAVDRIQDALALFLGRPAGELAPDGTYSADSVLGLAMARLKALWEMAEPRAG
jgi:ATP-dependent Lon protease